MPDIFLAILNLGVFAVLRNIPIDETSYPTAKGNSINLVGRSQPDGS